MGPRVLAFEAAARFRGVVAGSFEWESSTPAPQLKPRLR